MKNLKYIGMRTFTFQKVITKMMKIQVGINGSMVFQFEMILIRCKWFDFKRDIESSKLKMNQMDGHYSMLLIPIKVKNSL